MHSFSKNTFTLNLSNILFWNKFRFTEKLRYSTENSHIPSTQLLLRQTSYIITKGILLKWRKEQRYNVLEKCWLHLNLLVFLLRTFSIPSRILRYFYLLWALILLCFFFVVVIFYDLIFHCNSHNCR